MDTKRKAILIGVSGGSCSGKTTVARLLCKVFEGSFLLHEDDFYKPDDQIPYKNGIQDWDCVESLDLPRLEDALNFIRREGQLPPGFTSKEEQNEVHTVKLKHPERLERWRHEANLKLGDGRLPLCIVDGFLLYSERMKHIHELFDVKFFIAIDYKTMKERREGRKGYVTIEGFWEDPPGYVDDIVWPRYVEEHAYLFNDGNVNLGYDRQRCSEVGLQPSIPEAAYDLDAALDWTCQRLIDALPSIKGSVEDP